MNTVLIGVCEIYLVGIIFVAVAFLLDMFGNLWDNREDARKEFPNGIPLWLFFSAPIIAFIAGAMWPWGIAMIFASMIRGRR